MMLESSGTLAANAKLQYLHTLLYCQALREFKTFCIQIVSITVTHLKIHRKAGPPKWKCICINFHCRGPALRCIYLSKKRSVDDQTYRHKI